jgi:hypothetical protein
LIVEPLLEVAIERHDLHPHAGVAQTAEPAHGRKDARPIGLEPLVWTVRESALPLSLGTRHVDRRAGADQRCAGGSPFRRHDRRQRTGV